MEFAGRIGFSLGVALDVIHLPHLKCPILQFKMPSSCERGSDGLELGQVGPTLTQTNHLLGWGALEVSDTSSTTQGLPLWHGGSSQRRVTPQDIFSVKLIDTLYLGDHYWDFNLRLICFFVVLHACFCLYSDMKLFHFSTFNFIISLFNNNYFIIILSKISSNSFISS